MRAWVSERVWRFTCNRDLVWSSKNILQQTGSPAVEDSSPSLAASSSRVASSSAAQSSAAVSATPDGEDDEAPQEGVETEVFASVFSEEENFREVKRVKLLGPTYGANL